MFAPNYLPAIRYGGPVRSSHGLATGLVASGHEVHVFTTNVDGAGVLDVSLGEQVELDGVHVRYFPVTTPRRIYYSPAMARAVYAEIASFDVVHTNGMFLWPGPRIARAALRAGVALFVSPRGMLVPEMISGKSTLVKHAWIRMQERGCLEGARAIHVTSWAEAEGVRKLGLDLAPLVVIANGVDGPDTLPSEDAIGEIWDDVPVGRRVAVLARLDWTKGVDLAIEAVRSLTSAQLLIAGHDQIGLQAQLEPRLTRDNGTQAGRFIGPVDGTAKWALLTGADVVVVPSVKESFGMTVAEALVVGTPVICTPGVGAAEIVRQLDPACIVERDAGTLAQALATLLADQERRRVIGQHAVALMQDAYSWHAIAQQMAVAYQDQTLARELRVA